MPKFRLILVFAGWFLLAYGLLIAPWPGAKPIYASYFRWLGRVSMENTTSRRLLDFQPLNDPEHKWPANFDTAIILANRDLLDADGKGQHFVLTVDAWQMGWTPTAFLLALILATPIPCRRRLWAIFWGWLWIQIFIIITLSVFIWNESTRLSLVSLTPFWKGIANRVEHQALSPVGPSFFIGALIWILVAFRRQDLAANPPAGISDRSQALPTQKARAI